MVFPYLDTSTNLPPSGVVQAQPPTYAKLVGGTGKGRRTSEYLASKVLILKGQGGGMHCVHLPLDPLLALCTSSR